uniref:AT1G08220-like protein n=1 Tax=Monsonia marlothii TaxID=163685 RepID=A0A0G4AMP9_9ROSI|nr:AT1G08220-like protein [Monsonia marlothii]
MMRLKRLVHHGSSISPAIRSSRIFARGEEDKLVSLPSPLLAQWSSNRFFDIHKMVNKEAIEKERERLADELNRGYFADMNELKKHGGKIAAANKIIIPAMAAQKFPAFEVNYSDGRTLKLPVIFNGNAANADGMPNPKASLLCLSFRANSQAMINSWSVPFLDTFSASKDVELYEVSFIDFKLLCWNPIKKLLLRSLRSSNPVGRSDALQRQIVYSFGDHYYFRKELRILNLLTGYIYLLDKFGRIRWQGSGLASKEELGSLLSCTSLLLEET